jgi:hypothetical protein
MPCIDGRTIWERRQVTTDPLTGIAARPCIRPAQPDGRNTPQTYKGLPVRVSDQATVAVAGHGGPLYLADLAHLAARPTRGGSAQSMLARAAD